ncbi:MAG: 4-hydroxy-3-methylbut-2-enyl diphosphate reductase [Candidatus Sumerlaeaceae bacterium]|nr:4-hydroxy-3-methylbut-2-enyl diphosphate reductase [Candidatus Sumerlaeaceae bacterium]
MSLTHPVRPDNPSGRPDPSTGIYRHGFGLKGDVAGAIAGDYRCPLVDLIRNSDFQLEAGGLTILLAREFGFCYGVDKAVDYAYQTRRMFPDRRIFLTTEIIHNPRVNRRLMDMGIQFLAGQYACGVSADSLGPEDVVILPAFGASVEETERLRATGCTLVDTTCGSVILVWKRVEKYAREGFTAIIHGKYYHEETVGTSSRVTQFPGGRYLVLRDKTEAALVCDFIRGLVPATAVHDRFAPHAVSAGFDAERDLVRIGMANQTTMLSSESLEIAGMLRDAMAERYGVEQLDEHYRHFDTICSATQERQDAILHLGALNPDAILVVGGYNSSNTAHLVEIAGRFAPAYHVEDVSGLLSADEIRHRPFGAKEPVVSQGWLPPLPARIGLTAGASTPNKAVGDVVRRLGELYGVTWPDPETGGEAERARNS